MTPTLLCFYKIITKCPVTVFIYLFQKIGVQIFNKRAPDDRLETQDVLALVERYPSALLLYLEFLIHDLNSEVGKAAAT